MVTDQSVRTSCYFGGSYPGPSPQRLLILARASKLTPHNGVNMEANQASHSPLAPKVNVTLAEPSAAAPSADSAAAGWHWSRGEPGYTEHSVNPVPSLGRSRCSKPASDLPYMALAVGHVARGGCLNGPVERWRFPSPQPP
jgi:hypothetical protein